MKAFKRNAVIITVVLFVCVAAYLNWVYGREDPLITEAGSNDAYPSGDFAGSQSAEENGSPANLYFSGDADSQTSSAYFAETRLSRQQARDSAVETLSTVQAAAGASQEIVDSALNKITEIAANSQKEAELEALIRAKGFSDCVVFISDDSVKVTVPAPIAGLSSVDVAKITEIITAETPYSAAQLNVIEVKAE